MLLNQRIYSRGKVFLKDLDLSVSLVVFQSGVSFIAQQDSDKFLVVLINGKSEWILTHIILFVDLRESF